MNDILFEHHQINFLLSVNRVRKWCQLQNHVKSSTALRFYKEFGMKD